MLLLARNSDPETSHAAAAIASQSAARREAMIYTVLRDFGPMNSEGIAETICERYSWKPDSVAVCRLLKTMERNNLIRYAGYTLPNRNGCRARAMEIA